MGRGPSSNSFVYQYCKLNREQLKHVLNFLYIVGTVFVVHNQSLSFAKNGDQKMLLRNSETPNNKNLGTSVLY